MINEQKTLHMKITITDHSKGDAGQSNLLYNIVKRNEEDLMRRIPNLKEFVIDLRKFGYDRPSSGSAIISKHHLSDDESSLLLSLGFRTEAPGEKLVPVMIEELKKIKAIYN